MICVRMPGGAVVLISRSGLLPVTYLLPLGEAEQLGAGQQLRKCVEHADPGAGDQRDGRNWPAARTRSAPGSALTISAPLLLCK